MAWHLFNAGRNHAVAGTGLARQAPGWYGRHHVDDDARCQRATQRTNGGQ
jgi:hypothetical protein